MLDDIKKTLWATADKLRANMDAAEYKHLVLGLIFVKYVSDTFHAKRAELTRRFADPADEYFIADSTPELLAGELEDRDYYREVNVFWVPEAARWETLRAAAKQPDIGKRIDDALSLIEAENPKLKGILDKRFARAQLPDGKLGELVDLVSTIGFGASAAEARDVLGQVYEYFLGMFASAEGKRGGQFYTPRSIVKTLVAVLAPHHGKVYDPCCGSGGMFVQSEEFIEAHGGKIGDVAIFGQEANPTTWRLAAMNLAIRGIDFNLGREPADTFTRDQFPDLRADFILANPPFNISDWWHASLSGDARWHYGDPPQGNANYAWLQHMLHHLKPGGRAGIVLANGSMSSSQNNEGQIRAAMVEADVVEVMIALPGQLFFNTQIPACLWFLAKDKRARPGEVLFIDVRKLATMISRVQCDTLFEHYSLPAFDAGQMPVRELGAEIKSNKTSVPADAVLLSKLNPHIPRVWLPVDAGQHAVCSTEFLVFVPAARASREFAYCSFVAAPFQERLRQLVTGTSNSHQRVKPDGVATLSTVVPPGQALDAFTSVVRPVFERVGRNRLQAQTLATLRDTLLPRLISGQLRLPQAEALAA